MSWLFEHLLGVLRPALPHQWRNYVWGLTRVEGWVPPMLIIAAAGVLLMAVIPGFGLFGAHPAIRTFNYLAVATWFIVATTATVVVLIQGMRNLLRFSTLAIARPRWWFELSRIAWITTLLVGLSVPLLQVVDAAPFANALKMPAVALLVFFWTTGSLGYLASLFTRRRRNGKAYECVQYFYWISIAIVSATMAAIWGANGPVLVVTCVVAAVTMGVVLLKISERTDRKEARYT
mgnify:CR=1 FL=1